MSNERALVVVIQLGVANGDTGRSVGDIEQSESISVKVTQRME